MKKILLATTVLVGTAGFAAAEVSLSGDARMGIVKAADVGDASFTSRARVAFALSGESDSGLSFGASFRADNAGDASSGTGGSVSMSGAFGKISMGDVDGAAVAAVGQVDGVGLTGLGDGNELVYIGSGGFGGSEAVFEDDFGVDVTSDPAVLYEYTAGAVAIYASVTNPGYEADGEVDDIAAAVDGIAYALGAAYTAGDYKVSVGYENVSVTVDGVDHSATHTVVGGDATFGAITVKARYGVGSGDAEADRGLTQYALSATYSADAMSATIYTRNLSGDGAAADLLDVQTIGIGGAYDLGGGAKVVGGVARVNNNVTDDNGTVYDLGVSFSF